MVLNGSEVLFTPKFLYWFGNSELLNDDVKIEFLKNDFFIKNYVSNIDELANLVKSNNEFNFYIFDLDKLIIRNNRDFRFDITLVVKLIKLLKEHELIKYLIFTKITDDEITGLFRANGIKLTNDKNFIDKANFADKALSVIKPHFLNQIRLFRAYIRLTLYPQRMHRIEINTINGTLITEGYLKDISLNGIGIILFDEKSFSQFNINDKVEIKIFMPRKIIHVKESSIARLESKELLLGLNFDLNDNKVIRKSHSTYLTSIIYDWIKVVLNNSDASKNLN
jgi:hypothetical protein